MAKGKKHMPEQIVSLLRQIEVSVANGKTTPIACREGGITEQTYYRGRKEFGGLQVDQARRLKELGQENAKLKWLVSELSLGEIWCDHFGVFFIGCGRNRGSSPTPGDATWVQSFSLADLYRKSHFPK